MVLVHLRDRFRAATAAGEGRVYVDREDVVEYVAGFRPRTPPTWPATRSGPATRSASVNKAGLLIGSPTDDRFEISEAIESLLPLELLKELLVSLQQTNDPESEPDEEGLFESSSPPPRTRTRRTEHAVETEDRGRARRVDDAATTARASSSRGTSRPPPTTPCSGAPSCSSWSTGAASPAGSRSTCTATRR